MRGVEAGFSLYSFGSRGPALPLIKEVGHHAGLDFGGNIMTTDYKFTIPIRCSYCRVHMGYKPCEYDPKDAKTDGICPTCYERVMADLEKKIKANKK